MWRCRRSASLCVILLRAPEHEQECGTGGGAALSCFSGDADLVSMLGDTLLLFREISVRPSSQFISSRNHELSKLSYNRGSACRQVSVSTAAQPKYLLNPSSLFNYLCVLEKWCKPSCIYDTLPTAPVKASWCGRWTLNKELNEHKMESSLGLCLLPVCLWTCPWYRQTRQHKPFLATSDNQTQTADLTTSFKHADAKCSVNLICEALRAFLSVAPEIRASLFFFFFKGKNNHKDGDWQVSGWMMLWLSWRTKDSIFLRYLSWSLYF